MILDQWVSVTLFRWRGASGLRPRAAAKAVGHHIEGQDRGDRIERRMSGRRRAAAWLRARRRARRAARVRRARACRGRAGASRPAPGRAVRTPAADSPRSISSIGPCRTSALENASAWMPEVSFSLSAASCAIARPRPRPITIMRSTPLQFIDGVRPVELARRAQCVAAAFSARSAVRRRSAQCAITMRRQSTASRYSSWSPRPTVRDRPAAADSIRTRRRAANPAR